MTSTGDGNSFVYDNNGNLTSDNTRTLLYSTFDKAIQISKGNHSSRFLYGPERGRYLQVETNSTVAEKNKTTLYVGNIERVKLNDGTYEWRRSVTGGQRTYTTDSSFAVIGDEEKRYIFKDHLGSVDVIADDLGNLEQSMSFDPWGARRQQDSNLSLFSDTQLFGFDDGITSRGYTGHEMLDELGLIHMNGRIYDARLARFAQADPFVQAAADVQMYNRYSYVRNNPLNATDPSGYILKSLSRRFGFAGGHYFLHTGDLLGAHAMNAVNSRLAQNDTFAQWAPTVAGIVSAAICGPCSIGVTAMVTADITYYRTGSFGAAARAGAISAAYGGITYGIGQGLSANYGANNAAGLSSKGYALKIASHAVVGGIMAEVQGGKFGNGFVSAAASSYAPGGNGSGQGNFPAFAQGVIISALVGGTSSVLSGGKFANGAKSGAIVYALNSATDKGKEVVRKGTLQKVKQFAGWFWDDLKSGVVRDRIMLAVNAELSIAAGLAEGALTYATGGAAGAFIGMHGAGNLAGGIGDYLDIFDGGSRDWNFTRQGYENIFTFAGQDTSAGARAFYFTDAAIGVGALLSPVTVNYVGPLTITGQTTVPAFTRTNPVILTHDAVQIGSSINSGASN